MISNVGDSHRRGHANSPNAGILGAGRPSVLILNGPNLGRLGVREPEIYGADSLADLEENAANWGATLGLSIEARQTNDEAELVGWIHKAIDNGTHIVLNPAAFTHYSYALRDAAAMVTKAGLILVEVHLSNPETREQFRHHSTISGVATGTIAGFGFDSYKLALYAIASKLGCGKPVSANAASASLFCGDRASGDPALGVS